MPIFEDKSFKDYVNSLPAATDVSSTDMVSSDETNGNIVKVDGNSVAKATAGTDQIHNLTQTATEADLNLRGYMPYDTEEVTKRFPVDLLASAAALLLEKNRAIEEERRLEGLFTGDTQDAVNAWLDAHPEATTSVQDNSITSQKIESGFLKQIKNTYNTPEMFGAVGDGTTDDTSALQEALDNSSVVLLGEKNYLITSTLKVDVSKVSLMGMSTLSRILLASTFPENVPAVLFYSTGDYYTRYKRGREHGNFTINGYNRATDGIKIGGDSGIYAGSIESNTFRNIRLYNCRRAIEISRHCYFDRFVNLQTDSCTYAIYTTESYDNGEIVTFDHCALYSGALLLRCSMEFIACAIHALGVGEVTGHSASIICISNFMYTFTDCHFESLNASSARNCPLFLSLYGAKIAIRNADAVVTGKITYNTPIFKVVQSSATSGDTGMIIIDGGIWKYFFGRCSFGADVDAICDGNVVFNNITYKHVWDNLGISKPFRKELFRGKADGTFDHFQCRALGETGSYTISTDTSNDENTLTLNIPEYSSNGGFSFYRDYDVTGKHIMLYKVSPISVNGSTPSTFHFNFTMDNGVKFFDRDGNEIAAYPSDECGQLSVFTDVAYGSWAGPAAQIPSNAVRARVRFGGYRDGGFGAGTYAIKFKSFINFI